jgi:haloacetate dehalogenase
LLDHWAGDRNALSKEAVDEYGRCFDAACVRATNEEFRAAASIDLDDDAADKDRMIACPTLVLWSAQSMWAEYDILDIWRGKAVNVEGKSLDCGHFLPEEDPDTTANELLNFLLLH